MTFPHPLPSYMTKEATMPSYHVIFDGPPDQTSGRFVEVENDQGESIGPGRWEARGAGMWALILPAPEAEDARG